ncbi:MAG: tetratricopeptide repeat protein [Deltaproteobacteria bacterium]|nr:tetratricopeptide repeat protein [Deltaproteobacteria bacterium]
MASRTKSPMDQMSAHVDRAWDRMAAGDIAGALRSAEKALEMDRENPEVQNLMGYVLAAEGRAEEAIEHYRQAIELDESFVEAMLNATEVLLFPLRDWDAAIAMVEQALEWIEEDAELADALLLQVDAHLGKGSRDDAERVLRRVPKGPFENAGIEVALGRAWFELGRADEAEPRLERAIALEPDLADAHYYLGLCREQRKDMAGMAVAFLRARDADLRTGLPLGPLSPSEFEDRVRGAIESIPETLAKLIDGAFVIVGDVPGAEVVAEGVDPRIPVLLDGLSQEGEPPKASRVFVYRRNVERFGVGEPKDLIAQAIIDELRHTFPELATGTASEEIVGSTDEAN